MLLKHYLEQGVSKAELARQFQLSRRTIHYWIESGQLDRELTAGAGGYARWAPVAHKLDPYKRIIEARLEVYPKLTAQRLYEELRAAGYPGSYGNVRDYVRQVRPRETVDPVVRFETPPGRQGQVDFGSFRLPWPARRRPWRHGGRESGSGRAIRPRAGCAASSRAGPPAAVARA